MSWKWFSGSAMPPICGLLGSCAALLLATAPGIIAWLAAGIVVTLSAFENEPLILLVVFLMPVGWMLAGDTPVRNVYVVFHGLVVAGFFLGRSLRRKIGIRNLIYSPVSRASLLFLSVATVPAIFNSAKRGHESTRSIVNLLAYVGFYFLVLAWANSRERVIKIQFTILISTVLTALFAVYQAATGGYSLFWRALYPAGDYQAHPEWVGRAASFLSSPNNLAGYLGVVLPFALACGIGGCGGWKRLGAWTFGLGVVALLSTQGLGGLMGLVAFLVLAVLRFVPTSRRKLAVLGCLGLLVGMLYVSIHIVSPIHTSEQLESDWTTRLFLWASAWNLFTHSPLLGVGWGNFTAVFGLDRDPYFIPDQVAAHNIYLQLLSETGLIGFLAFFYLVFQSWKQAGELWRASDDSLDRALAFGVQGAIVATLVHGLVDFLFQANPQYGTLFWMMLALLVARSRAYSATAAAPELAGSGFGMRRVQAI